MCRHVRQSKIFLAFSRQQSTHTLTHTLPTELAHNVIVATGLHYHNVIVTTNTDTAFKQHADYMPRQRHNQMILVNLLPYSTKLQSESLMYFKHYFVLLYHSNAAYLVCAQIDCSLNLT